MMALYGFEDYSADEYGGYTFRRSDGTETYAGGPEAEQLARELDRTRYQGATAMAGAGGTGGMDNPDLTGHGMGSVETRPAIRADVPIPNIDPNAPPRKPPPAEQAPPPPPQQRQSGLGDLLNNPLVSAGRYVPGRAPVDPERMQREGRYVDANKTTTRVTEGAPYSEEEAQRRADIEIDYERAVSGKMRAEAEKNQLYSTQLEEQRMTAEESLRRKQAITQQAQQRVDDQWKKLVVAQEEEARSGPIDSQRLFREKGTLATIGAVISQAFGAYGATLGGGPNYAQQIIDSAIKADIESQKEEIRAKGMRANNALAAYTQAVGNQDAAERVLAAAMGRIADVQAEQYSVAMKGAAPEQQVKAFIAERQAKRMAEEKAYKDAAYGREQVNVAQQFVQPQAGSRGGYAPASADDILRRAKMLGDLQEQDQKLSGPGDDVDPKLLAEYGAEKTAIADARTSLQQLARVYGVEIMPDGTVKKPDDWDGISGHGLTGAVFDLATTREGMDVRQAQGRALAAYIRAISGKQSTAEEKKDLGRNFLGSTDNDAFNGLGLATDELSQKERSIEASYPEEVVRYYERRRAEEAARSSRETQGRATGVRRY